MTAPLRTLFFCRFSFPPPPSLIRLCSFFFFLKNNIFLGFLIHLFFFVFVSFQTFISDFLITVNQENHHGDLHHTQVSSPAIFPPVHCVFIMMAP